MINKRIVCENLRSAYNVGSIIRTADGLGRGVILVGYTAPKEHRKVSKTALGAENSVPLLKFDTLSNFYIWIQDNQICMVSAEKIDQSLSLLDRSTTLLPTLYSGQSLYTGIAVVMGNEITGVESETMAHSHYIVHIPMIGIKESFNVAQAAAIVMREVGRGE